MIVLFLLMLAGLGTSTATTYTDHETEYSYFAGVDRLGMAVAISNDDGSVLFESPEFPRGLWIHLRSETGEVLPNTYVIYRSLYAAPDPGHPLYGKEAERAGLLGIFVWGLEAQYTEIWIRPDGTPLHFTIKAPSEDDLPDRIYYIDWRIDPSAEPLLEPQRTELAGWNDVWHFLQQYDGVTVKILASPLAIRGYNVDEVYDFMYSTAKDWQKEGRPMYAQTVPRVTTELRSETRSWLFPTNVILYVPVLEDPDLEDDLRQQIEPHFTTNLDHVRGLRKDWRPISLQGLEHLTNLRGLRVGQLQNNDLSPLANITSLQTMELFNSEIEDISPLANLVNLYRLELHDNRISDIGPLRNMAKMEYLTLSNNKISVLEPLAGLTELKWLYLDGNLITDFDVLENNINLTRLRIGSLIEDVSSLEKLPVGLEDLEMSNNAIEDITPVGKLVNLKYVKFEHNHIKDISVLEKLIYLYQAFLSNNRIEDIRPLVDNPNLGAKEGRDYRVTLENNPLSQESIDKHIPELISKGVKVWYTK